MENYIYTSGYLEKLHFKFEEKFYDNTPAQKALHKYGVDLKTLAGMIGTEFNADRKKDYIQRDDSDNAEEIWYFKSIIENQGKILLYSSKKPQ